ncbi:MAG TPA: hypothetical protein VG826_12880 [Pirellulales bacterium]|nr:hypothetical protein [Pirellulales bacterium]
MNDEEFQAKLNAISTPVKQALETPGRLKSRLWEVYHALTGKGSITYRRVGQVGDMLGRLGIGGYSEAGDIYYGLKLVYPDKNTAFLGLVLSAASESETHFSLQVRFQVERGPSGLWEKTFLFDGFAVGDAEPFIENSLLSAAARAASLVGEQHPRG